MLVSLMFVLSNLLDCCIFCLSVSLLIVCLFDYCVLVCLFVSVYLFAYLFVCLSVSFLSLC